MNYICPTCGTGHPKKPTYEDIIEKVIPESGVEIDQLHDTYGYMMTDIMIDIILNRLLMDHKCYIPSKGRIALCNEPIII